jgi:hypothetical protein
VAVGAGDVGLFHLRNMCLGWDRSSQSRCPVVRRHRVGPGAELRPCSWAALGQVIEFRAHQPRRNRRRPLARRRPCLRKSSFFFWKRS